MVTKKSLFNELNVAIRECAAQLLRRIMHVWRHQQLIVTPSAERKPSEWDRLVCENRTWVFETRAGCLRSIYPSLDMIQLFGDVTIVQWRHN